MHVAVGDVRPSRSRHVACLKLAALAGLVRAHWRSGLGKRCRLRWSICVRCGSVGASSHDLVATTRGNLKLALGALHVVAVVQHRDDVEAAAAKYGTTHWHWHTRASSVSV